MPTLTPDRLFSVVIDNSATFNLTFNRHGRNSTVTLTAGIYCFSNAGVTLLTYPATSTVTQHDQEFFFKQDDLTNAPFNVPIGSIIAWHKSFPGTPALPGNFVECNGQVLNDPASPFDGQTIPDLNGDGRYLRGAAASGTMQDDATAVNGLTVAEHPAHTHPTPELVYSGYSGYYNDGNSYYIASAYPTDNVSTTNTNAAKTGTNHRHTISHTHPADATGNNSAQAHTPSGDAETRPITMTAVMIMRIK